MSISARRARTASTAYQPLERFGPATLLDIEPRTGRTHQIRVHLASRGWPIVADSVYGVLSERALAAARRRWGRAELVLETMPRQALHAHRIRFAHPVSGAVIEVEAPVPKDLDTLLRGLRAAVSSTGECG